MGQLTEQLQKQLYPNGVSTKLWFVNHVLNGAKLGQLDRLLRSVRECVDEIFVLIDDRTTDNTEQIVTSYGGRFDYFKWQHDFSYAKNLAIKKAGVKFGEWILVAGADFELQQHTIPEINAFREDPYNFMAQFWIPESEGGVTRKRKLFWRHSPVIYWERLVHEEMVWSAYRATGIGISFSKSPLARKEVPILGGENGMVHYGFAEDGTEEGERFQWKKAYYLILTQLDIVMQRLRIPDVMEAARWIYNNEGIGFEEGKDLDWFISSALMRYRNGDVPMKLTPWWDTLKIQFPGDYD